MFSRFALRTGTVLSLLAGSAAAAQAQAPAGPFDSCTHLQWQQFSDAVEANDTDALATLMVEIGPGDCGLYATAELLVCAQNPVACIEPAAGTDPTEPVIEPEPEDEPHYGPSARPGFVENHDNDTDESIDDGGNDDGGNTGGGTETTSSEESPGGGESEDRGGSPTETTQSISSAVF